MDKPVSSSENTWKTITKFFKKNPEATPGQEIIPLAMDSLEIVEHDVDITRLNWFGHSSFLLQMDGKKILIDPMLGERASPTFLYNIKRFSSQLPIEVEKLPFIDAVIYSHDHYDHLDYDTVKKIKDKVGVFYTPLGLGAHLEKWGVEASRIIELDWWEEVNFDGIQLACTPAQHFSGRGVFDQAETLWVSWVILGKKDRIYFSGDSGYGEHFKEIGEKYGPFDIALMECGQYDPDWKHIHMFPEETAQAAQDVNSKRLVPIHWGAFKLAHHSWVDPIERVSVKSDELGIQLLTPRIGEALVWDPTASQLPQNEWWKQYQKKKATAHE